MTEHEYKIAALAATLLTPAASEVPGRYIGVSETERAKAVQDARLILKEVVRQESEDI